MKRLPSLIIAVLLGGLVAGCGPLGGDPATTAKELMAKKDHGAAIIALKSGLQKTPDAPAMRFLLGKALLATGDPVGALVELNKALELGHDEQQLLPELVKALAATGKGEEATRLYGGKRLASPAANAELQTALAAAWGFQGNNARMLAAIDAALADDPEHATANVVKARLLGSEGKTDAAWAVVERVLQRDPKMSAALHYRGLLLRYHRQDADAARIAQQQALASEPTLVQAHAELLSMAYEKKDIAAMRQQLAAMQKALPKNLNTFLFQAQIEFLDNRLPRAREIVQQLLKAKQPDVRALVLAAQIDMRMGSFSQAETYLTRVLNEQPTLDGVRPMLAATQIRLGRTDRAVRTLQPLLDRPNPPADVLALTAEAYLHAGNPAKAQDFFARAEKANPGDPRIRTALALNRVASGETDAGIADLQRVAESDKGTFADLALVSTLMRRQDFEGALAALQRAEKKAPNAALLPHLRGQILQARKDVDGAQKAYAQALSIDPKYFASAFALGAIDVGRQDYVAAKRHFEEILKLDAAHPRAMLAIADLKLRNKEPMAEVLALLTDAVRKNPTEVDPRLALVKFHRDQNDLKAALSAGQDGLAMAPSNPQLLDAVGSTQLALGEYQQALATFQKLVAALPDSPQPHIRIADVHSARGDNAPAVASLQRALEIDPQLLAANARKVQLLLADKKPGDALQVARRVQKDAPKQALGWQLEGQVLAAQRQWEGAIAAFRAASTRQASTRTAIDLHRALVNGGKGSEAERLAAEWRRQHPKDAAFVLYLGSLAVLARDWPSVESLYRDALGLVPDQVSANNNVALALLAQKKPGALPLAEKANRLAPDTPAVMDTLAQALLDAGEVNKALELQKKVIAKAPDFLSGRLTLARIAIRAGDRTLARTELEKLAYEGARFAEQAEVARLLKDVQ